MATPAEYQPAGAEQIADWAETLLLVADSSYLSNDRLDGLAESLGILPSDVSLGTGVMARRSTVLGDTYPFEVSDFAIQRHAEATTSPYVGLLLMTATAPVRRVLHPTPPATMTVLIEHMAVAAMRTLLGPGSEALRFGIPSDVGRPTDFNQAVHWLANKMGLPVGSAFRPSRRGDGGLDVVAWRPFPDRRTGMPVMLVQCTVQEDFSDKTNDINLDDWLGWLQFDVKPTKVLVVPDAIPHGEKWNEVSVRSLVLDRVRVAHLLSGTPPDEIQGLESFIAEELSSAASGLAELL